MPRYRSRSCADSICSLSGNGHLTENELRTALVNGDWTAFDMHTVRMMMRYVNSELKGLTACTTYWYMPLYRMFDTDRSGAITFDEFWWANFPLLNATTCLDQINLISTYIVASGASSLHGAISLIASTPIDLAPSSITSSATHLSRLDTGCRHNSCSYFTELMTGEATTGFLLTSLYRHV